MYIWFESFVYVIWSLYIWFESVVYIIWSFVIWFESFVCIIWSFVYMIWQFCIYDLKFSIYDLFFKKYLSANILISNLDDRAIEGLFNVWFDSSKYVNRKLWIHNLWFFDTRVWSFEFVNWKLGCRKFWVCEAKLCLIKLWFLFFCFYMHMKVIFRLFYCLYIEWSPKEKRIKWI